MQRDNLDQRYLDILYEDMENTRQNQAVYLNQQESTVSWTIDLGNSSEEDLSLNMQDGPQRSFDEMLADITDMSHQTLDFSTP